MMLGAFLQRLNKSPSHLRHCWLPNPKGGSNWDLRLTRCQPSKGNCNLLLNTKKSSLYVDESWWRPWYEILPHKGTYVFKSSLWHPEEILKPFCLITRYSISCRFASIISIKIIFFFQNQINHIHKTTQKQNKWKWYHCPKQWGVGRKSMGRTPIISSPTTIDKVSRETHAWKGFLPEQHEW